MEKEHILVMVIFGQFKYENLSTFSCDSTLLTNGANEENDISCVKLINRDIVEVGIH